MDNQYQIWNDADSRLRLTRVALAVLHSPVLAEEVVQEAYLRLLESEDGFVENPLSWLVKVTRNLAIDKARRSLRESEILLLMPGLVQMGRYNDHHATESRLAEMVSCLLYVSDSHNTAIVLLHVVFGLSYEEIAKICGRTPAACRQSGSRALRKCFDAINAEESYDEASNIDMYVHAILDASAAPLINSLVVSLPVSMHDVTTNIVSSEFNKPTSNTGRTRQVLVLTDSGVQWALVLDGITLCFLSNTVRSSSVTATF